MDESFLRGPSHPIAIPESQLPYEQLEAAGLVHQQVTVILPNDERFEAEICQGGAGCGVHYLLRFNGGNQVLPSYLKLNDHLLVITRQDGSSELRGH